MKDKIFGVLQRVGRSFMLPIALLPVAGLLLGIGSSFTNATMLEAYGLTGVIYEGSVIYTVLDIMNQCGSAIFNNLPLLFAMGVAIGMAKKEKEVAALSGAIAYLIMNTAISALINAHGGVEAMAANSTTSMLGITTLQMGVFGGVIVGLGVAALHNKFYKIELPQVLSFFGGTRFVPIVSSIVFLIVGIGLFFVWPVVQNGIAALGNLVIRSGYAGTWIYGLIERRRPGHVPGRQARKAEGRRRPFDLRRPDLHAHRHHRAVGVHLPLCGPRHVRGPLRLRRPVLHADAHL